MTNPESKRPDGVTILAIWYLVLAGGLGLIACAAAVPAAIVTSSEAPAGSVVLAVTLLGIGVLLAMATSVALAAIAWGLWQLRDWARLAALVVGALHLLAFPIGTVIGAITLWYLSSHPEVQAAFRR
jgi:hypothetical protein